MRDPWKISLVILLALSAAANLIQALSGPARLSAVSTEVPGQEIAFTVSTGIIGGSIDEMSDMALSQSYTERCQTIHFPAPDGVVEEGRLKEELKSIQGVREAHYWMGTVTVKREPGFTFIPTSGAASIGQRVAETVARYKVRA